MENITIARVIHVLAVVLWIGGVAMVTTVIIPAVKKLGSKEDRIKTFEKIEGRFALQAKITTLLTGVSGFYMMFKEYVEENPSKTFSFLHKAHWVLLMLSLLTIAGAVAGSHGLFFIK